jgi:transposase
MLITLARKLKGGPKKLVGNRGFRRFLNIQGAAASINPKLFCQKARFDGKYVLTTNTALTPSDVAQYYKSPWQVEGAFRELKSGLELRSVYHWNDTRVEGHIMICFLTLVLEAALCRRLKEAGSNFSNLDLMDDLGELKAVE